LIHNQRSTLINRNQDTSTAQSYPMNAQTLRPRSSTSASMLQTGVFPQQQQQQHLDPAPALRRDIRSPVQNSPHQLQLRANIEAGQELQSMNQPVRAVHQPTQNSMIRSSSYQQPKYYGEQQTTVMQHRPVFVRPKTPKRFSMPMPTQSFQTGVPMQRPIVSQYMKLN